MVIENLSILDYLKLKNEIKYSLKKTYGFYNLFKIFNFKKIMSDNKVIMLVLYEKTDLNTINVKQSIIINKDYFKKIKGNILKSKYNNILFFSTDNYLFSKFITNTKQTNLILKLNLKDFDIVEQHESIFKIFDTSLHLNIRCEIQNAVFFDKDRIPLHQRDILYECKSNNYIPELAYFIEEKNKAIGYGQVLIIDNKYYIANLGVLSNYRNNGYGRKLLNYLILKAKEYGIDEIYIKVDKSNEIAFNLYKSIGFKFYKEINVFKID